MSEDIPANDCLEVSLFGPGFGECAVVHLQNGEWMIVDSHLGESGKPIAIEYFERLGVDYVNQVKLIVVTHWHDDHTKGISEIADKCANASICFSPILTSEQVANLVAAHYQQRIIDSISNIGEFAKLLEVLKAKSKGPVAPHKLVSESVLLYGVSHSQVQVFALSPSAASVIATKVALQKILPKSGKMVKRYMKVHPNDASVVIAINIGSTVILLGGDLECMNVPSRGWVAAINAYPYTAKSSVFKVPHHGSKNAYHPSVWEELLTPTPIAMVAPYNRGSSPLPTKRDVAKLLKHTEHAYITTGQPSKGKSRDRIVDGIMNEVAHSRFLAARSGGQIRVRLSLQDPQPSHNVALFRGARQLSG